ncbi:MAG: NHL domain-containing thioredoxin family protein [Lapillicoccus sp.]
MRTDFRTVRVRAPELVGRRWLNTGGADLTLAALRGRVVLLDFWTFCCVNCLHVIDELRPVEAQFEGDLVVIGVHSPKFAHEGEPAAVEAAVERYAVHHPVLDDPDLVTWQAYTARAWPTLVVVDPEGYVVATMSGEGHGPGLVSLVRDLVAKHSAKGTLRQGRSAYVPPPPPASALRFPGKVATLPDGSFVVSDTAHHQVVHLETDLVTERRRWGGPGVFDEPQGVLVLPAEEAARVGWDVLVADSVHHQVAAISLSTNEVLVVAGTGRPLRRREAGGPALEQDLSTPWDLAWWQDRVVVAMAGVHQLWSLRLDLDPSRGVITAVAGTTQEGLRDGPGEQAWLAQPSGLSTSADGERVWVADAETSALRVLDAEGLSTRVGTGLFEFGHRDGPADQALLQHPLGVTELPDGSVAVCDTYNGAVRRYDPVRDELSTLATGLAEPSDAVVEADGEGGFRLVVVESAAHRLVRVAIPADAQRVEGEARRTHRPPTALRTGPVDLVIAFDPPAGQKLDDRWGDPTQLVVSASPPELLLSGGGTQEGLTRALTLAPGIPAGTLHVSVRAAACDVAGENPACHLFQQDWGIPVTLVSDGPSRLELDLRGT